MAEQSRTTTPQDAGSTAETGFSGTGTASSACRSNMLGCSMGKKGIKGLVLMAACCGAPVLLLLALPLIGSALGSVGISALNTLAVLACPVGMALMLWLMMRGQQAEASRTEPVSVVPLQTAAAAPMEPQEEACGLPRHVNGHQETGPTPAVSRANTATLSDK